MGCLTNETNNPAKQMQLLHSLIPFQPLFIDNSEEEGWGADIRLSLTEITSTDSMVTYKATSSYEGRNVGPELTLPSAKPGIKNSPTQMLEIKTCDESSDNLLLLLYISKTCAVDLNEVAKPNLATMQ